MKLPKANLTGALMARMDDRKGSYRGWDLWLERGRIGAAWASFINSPDKAIKVVAQTPVKAGPWHHVFVTYDGSSKAAGVKLYVDGVVQEHNVANDSLQDD